MGFVMLGISTLTDVRHQRRAVRHGRPRPDHRHAVLPRRLGEAPLPHARDQAAVGAAHADAASSAGSSASARWPASACPAWPGSGASSRRSSSAYSPASGCPSALFRTLMVHRRARHRVRRRLPAVAVPAHRVRRADRRSSPVHWPRPTPSAPPSTTSTTDVDIHDVTVIEWIAWTPMLIAILVLGVYPQLLFKIIDPAVDRAGRPAWRAPQRRDRSRPRPGRRVAPRRRSTSTPSRPSWCSSSASASCSASTCSSTRAASGRRRRSTGFVLLGACVPLVTLAVHRRRRALAVRRALRRRRVLADPQGAVPAGRLRRRADEPERARGGRLLPGRVLRAAARAACSAW